MPTGFGKGTGTPEIKKVYIVTYKLALQPETCGVRSLLSRNLEVKITYAGFGEHWCSKTLHKQSTLGLESSEEEFPDF